jgi:peptidyl-prolyl cis-trans isomerase D
VQYRAAKSKPFDEVKAEVLASFTQQRALALAREEGKRRLAGRLTGDVSAIASASDFKVAVLSRITPDTSIPAEVARAGFEMDVVALPAWTGVDVKDGYAVIRLNAVQADPAPKDAQSAAALNQVAQMWAKAEADAYLLVLKSRFHVTIKVKKPEAGSDFGISSPSPGAEGK